MGYIGSIIAVVCGLAGAFLILKLRSKSVVTTENRGQRYRYLLEISFIEDSPAVSSVFYSDHAYRDPLSLLADSAEMRGKRFLLVKQGKESLAVNINAARMIRMQRSMMEEKEKCGPE